MANILKSADKAVINEVLIFQRRRDQLSGTHRRECRQHPGKIASQVCIEFHICFDLFYYRRAHGDEG